MTGEVSLEPPVSIIAPDAFRGARVGSVRLPRSLGFVGPGAFMDCKDLKKIVFENDCGITALICQTFYGCVALKEVILPDSLKVIGTEDFRNCGSLVEIRLPENLEVVGGSAFENCGLRSVEFPDSLVSICERAFSSNWNLRSIKFGSGPLSIDREAFLNCTALETLEIPESVIEIGKDAFEGCSSLRKVVLHTDLIDPEEFLPEHQGIEIVRSRRRQ